MMNIPIVFSLHLSALAGTGLADMCPCSRFKSVKHKKHTQSELPIFVVELEMTMQNQYIPPHNWNWNEKKGRQAMLGRDEELSEVTQLLRSDDESSGLCKSSCYVSARWVLALWSFLGFINLFTLRNDLNIAILAMVNDTNTSGSLSLESDASSADPPQFSWSETEQSAILSAFFYGYCSSQIIGGYMATVFGAKLVMGYSLLATSVLALFTPIATVHGYYLLMAVRVVQGFGQGLAQPCMHTMWSKWAPDSEKSKLLAFTFTGCQLGTVIVSLSAGIVCEHALVGGWPFVFYFYGGLGVAWSLGWLMTVHETPEVHPRISAAERKYIESSIGHESHATKTSKASLARIMRSPAFIAIVFAHFAADWGCFALTTCLPTFLHRILGYNLQENGLLSSLPFLVLMVTNPLSGYLADQMRSRKILSTKNARKLLNSIGLFVPAGLTLAVCLCDRSRTLIVTLLTLAVGFSGFTMAGYSVNHLDIAPEYAGILYAITNTVGTTSGFIGPAIVGFLTNGRDTIHQWNIFFYLSAAIFFVGGLVFALFAEGDSQNWEHTPKSAIADTEPDLPSNSSDSEAENSKTGSFTKSIKFQENYQTLSRNPGTGVGNIQSSPSDLVYDEMETTQSSFKHKTNLGPESDS